MKNQILIFSDLDGTLLDHQSYSWSAAEPALELIRKESIPLIFCSSKTSAEIQLLREKLKNREPFISENGGGIFIPKNYFTFSFQYTKETDTYKILELGISYPQVRAYLEKICKEVKIDIRGYGEMPVAQIAKETGLPLQEAQLAKQREFDEPFVIIDASEEHVHRLLTAIETSGLRWTKGGRYFHLAGKTDKGMALKKLKGLYEQEGQRVITVALGDNHNDFPMFNEADYPIVVQNAKGRFNLPSQSSHLRRAEGIGPIGWNKALLALIPELKVL